MIKDLTIVIDNVHAKSAAFLKAAISMSEQWQSHARVTLLTPGPLAAPELAPVGAYFITEESLRALEAERIAAARAIVEGATCPVEVCGFHDDVAWLVGDIRRDSRIADLIVAGSIYSWEVPWLRRRLIETLLISSGTPLLLLPTSNRPLGKVRHAVFGWKPSREAVRALHDLVAIAEPGARIEVVSIDAASEHGAAGGESGSEVRRHLVRHGFEVAVHDIARESWQTVAGALQAFAVEREADLLAIGGYAHSRVREIWLGGVTQDVIAEAELPILLSH